MDKIRPRRKPMSEINVVPYIDVMLVLLIVFMVTAPLLTQGIKVDLPDSASPMTPDQEPIIVSIDAKGLYYINIGANQKKPLKLEIIEDRIEKVLKNKPNTPVLLEGDEKAEYGWVIELMSSLQKEGIANVGLITEPPAKG